MKTKDIDSKVYMERREILKKNLGKGKAFFPGNTQCPINFKDNPYPFRQDSNFLYYFGISRPDLAALIDIDEDRVILFGNELSMDDIIWSGHQPKLSILAAAAGIQEVLPINHLSQHLSQSIRYLPIYRPDQVMLIHEHTFLPINLIVKHIDEEFIYSVSSQRSYKSSQELEYIHDAVSLTNQMHKEIITTAKAGMKESELVGIAQHFAWKHQSRFAFNPIMTIHGNILHNHHYHHTIQTGQMVLFDGGLETERGYCGDITRTFPVSKSFDPVQSDLYDVVQFAFEKAVMQLRPGVRFIDVHTITCVELMKGLVELGICQGDPEELVSQNVHTLFFQCGTGHMMGLDVHDMESLGEERIGYDQSLSKRTDFGWKSLRLGKALEPGFVVTVEPGLYIIPEWLDQNKNQSHFKDFVNYHALERLRYFGGIRIENNYSINENGANLLGEPLPFKRHEIENMRLVHTPTEIIEY